MNPVLKAVDDVDGDTLCGLRIRKVKTGIWRTAGGQDLYHAEEVSQLIIGRILAQFTASSMEFDSEAGMFSVELKTADAVYSSRGPTMFDACTRAYGKYLAQRQEEFGSMPALGQNDSVPLLQHVYLRRLRCVQFRGMCVIERELDTASVKPVLVGRTFYWHRWEWHYDIVFFSKEDLVKFDRDLGLRLDTKDLKPVIKQI